MQVEIITYGFTSVSNICASYAYTYSYLVYQFHQYFPIYIAENTFFFFVKH